MRKKVGVLLAALMLASFVMTGCGKGSTGTADNKDQSMDKSMASEDTSMESKEAMDSMESMESEKMDDMKSGDEDLLVFIADTTNESQGYSAKQFEKYGSDYGFRIKIMSDEGDAQKQSTAVGNAVTAGASVIYVNPCDINAIIPALQSARDAGVKIGLYSSDLAEEDASVRDFFVGANDDDAGKFAADAFNEHFPDGAKIVEVMGQTGHDAQIKRHSGFDKYKNDNIDVIDSKGVTQWATAEALAIMEDFIVKYGDEIEGVFCHWDNGATGVLEALKAAGMNDVYVVAVDGCKAGFDQVEAGEQSVTIMQNFVTMAQKAMDVARNAIDGKDFDAINYIDFDVVSKDNIMDFEVPEW